MSATVLDHERRNEIDAMVFRETLGNFPTGVVAVTAMVNGQPAGMVVGSFTSVSLDPPLVAYLPTKSSASYATLRQADRFCVNVLSVEHEQLCRRFASKNVDKFADVQWHLSESGSPRLEGAVAWIDCAVERTVDGGDHDIVLGRVLELEAAHHSSALLFYQGGYGGFRSRSLIAPFADNLREPLHAAHIAKTHMEALSDELDVACIAQAIVDHDIVIVAATGESSRTQIGRRMPFAPPFGAAFLTGGDLDEGVTQWTSHLRVTDEQRAAYRLKLETIAARGWSYGLFTPRFDAIWAEIARTSAEPPTPAGARRHASLLDELLPYYDPPGLPQHDEQPRILTAPVWVAGRCPLVLALFGLSENMSPAELERLGERLRDTARAVAEELAAGA
ncbi:flavin reductase family protein [Microbacterium sp. NC79]|uniref:flavin reductase family protein n=1 Tax=Microbacterium sp. NC79 TaxID=2851009 RepID=UPI001C2C30BA|nr:flavin reductase family protein [Microbacterium sp. NC79]MBV0895532.1 flavin reductase family protein [Microbacterium sp. NC79]